jgi:hypothetical protein
MKNKILVAVCFSLFSCSTVDYDQWTMRKKSVDLSNMHINLKINGYYQFIRKGSASTHFAYYFVMYANGYFAVMPDPTDWIKKSKSEIKGRTYFDWGKYEIDGERIIFQYFVGYSVSGGLPAKKYLVREARGNTKSDSLIIINSVRRKSGRTNLITVKELNPIEEYLFVPSDTLPPSDNWLMEDANLR